MKRSLPFGQEKRVPKGSAHMEPVVAESFHGAGTKKDLTGMVEIAQILRRLYIAHSADIHVSTLKEIRQIPGTKLSRKSRTPKAPNRVEL